MKHKVAVFALVLALFAGGEMTAYEEKAHADTSFGFSLFYNSLSPYGSWVPISGYGYGWYPAQVGPGWQPYLDGQWVWTNQGWTWVSYEPWGWATYHYGRWIYDSYYGWTWIPGTVWAPAWVSWYQSPGYVGWSPLPPDNNFFIEIGISFVDYDYGYYGPYYGGYYGGYHGHHKKHKKGHYYDNDYYAPGEHSVFVPEDKFTNRNAKLVALDREHNLTVMRNVKNVTNIKAENNKVYNYGPEKSSIERAAKGKITPVDLVDTDLATLRAGKGRDDAGKNGYRVFRPNIEKKAGESPFNMPSVKDLSRNARNNKDTGIKKGPNAPEGNKGDGLVQKRSVNTAPGKPYGNVTPDGYGVINRDKGRLKSGNAVDTPKKTKIGGSTNAPANKPARTERKPSTVTDRKNSTYNGPPIYNDQSRMKSNTTVNEGLKRNPGKAPGPKPVYSNPYKYQGNNRAFNQYPKPAKNKGYQRAPVQPRTNYTANGYSVQKPQAQYRQVQQKQPKASTSRKSKSADNSRYTNSAPRQYTSPPAGTGIRNFNPGGTKSHNGGSFVRSSGNR